MMRALGYNRLISMENFRQPNFALVAEILVWLTHRFEPDADIHTEFQSEEDRVALVRSVAEFMVRFRQM
jgi:clusterin-associated protein 1